MYYPNEHSRVIPGSAGVPPAPEQAGRLRSDDIESTPLGQRGLAAIDYIAPGGKCAADVAGFCARLRRRGVSLGAVRQSAPPANRSRRSSFPLSYYHELWCRPHPVVMEGVLSGDRKPFRPDIRRSLAFLDRVRASESAVEWLERAPYARRLRGRFQITCTVADAIDPRELQKIYWDAIDGTRVVARDLFIKVNYLSLHAQDASIRLRFSFGEEAFTDWRAWARARKPSEWSAELAGSIFPECGLITQNRRLHTLLEKIIGHPVIFPERIIYSNTPNGGAFFHHDYVPTHVGVLFAQLHGITGWLACPRHRLIEILLNFLRRPEFQRAWHRQFPSRRLRTYFDKLASGAMAPAEELESDEEGPLNQLINNNPAFIGHLIHLGAMRILRPGDVILLPAPTLETATWHSVFCLDGRSGLSLSFAMKRAARRKG